jgi:hypothetical protein
VKTGCSSVSRPDVFEHHGDRSREVVSAGGQGTPGRQWAPRGATAAAEGQGSGGRNPRSVSRMKQAGRVRGGVKPSGGCKTLETDRSRELESPAYVSWLPRSASAVGDRSPGRNRAARASPWAVTRRGGVRRSYSEGGVTPRASPSVFGPSGHTTGRPRGSTGPAGRSRAADLHGSGAPRKGEEGGPNRYGPTVASSYAGGGRNSMRGGRQGGDIEPAASGALNLRGAQRQSRVFFRLIVPA